MTRIGLLAGCQQIMSKPHSAKCRCGKVTDATVLVRSPSGVYIQCSCVCGKQWKIWRSVNRIVRYGRKREIEQIVRPRLVSNFGFLIIGFAIFLIVLISWWIL